jgi:transposase InsO family protein
MSPGHKKQMAVAVVAHGLCSGRSACRILRLARATLWYRAGQRSDRQQQMVARLHALSEAHPRYGYRRMAALLRQEGWSVGKRQIQRLRRVEGLRVPPTKRKIARRGHSTGLPTKATHRGHVWTWDFIADATVRGGALRMLTVLDEHTRECHVLRVDRALKSADVIALVKQAIAQHGAPEFIRSDNGSEFIAHELQAWLAAEQIRTIYIEPASPWQNGFVESFHGRFRDECLNREQLWTLTEARVVIEDFRIDYNTRRPHSRLGYRSPVNYAQLTAAPTPVGLRPPSVGTASTTTDRSTHNYIPD